MKRKTKKLLSILLSLIMVLSCIPCMTTSAFAAGKTIKQVDILGVTCPEIGKEATS